MTRYYQEKENYLVEKEKRYIIDGTTYIQRPLVLLQAKQLAAILKETQYPVDFGAFNPQTLVILADLMPKALAVILTPEGTQIRDKDLEALAEDISCGIDMETLLQAVTDFFEITDIMSIMRQAASMVLEAVTLAAEKQLAAGKYELSQS